MKSVCMTYTRTDMTSECMTPYKNCYGVDVVILRVSTLIYV